MAITATKTHGELVSKAWTALGGDCAAEVVQLMSLANDWEDLILAGVGLDYKPERSTMNMSGKSTRKLMNLVGGNFFMPPPTPASPPPPTTNITTTTTTTTTPLPSVGGGVGEFPSPLLLPTQPSVEGGEGGNGTFSLSLSHAAAGAADGVGGGTPLDASYNPSLVARALSGESGGVKERMSVRARNAHGAGIEWRISAKVRAVLEREAAAMAGVGGGTPAAVAIPPPTPTLTPAPSPATAAVSKDSTAAAAAIAESFTF